MGQGYYGSFWEEDKFKYCYCFRIQYFMKISRCLLIVLTIVLSLLHTQNCNSVNSTLLLDNWNVTILNCSNSARSQYPNDIINKTFQTSIPTTLHLDLQAHNQIQDPYFRDNYPQLQWISHSTVKYTKNFNVPQQLRQIDKAIELVFYGIDTYAEISLNGEVILQTDNAFREYVVRIDKVAKENNVLEVKISPTQIWDNDGQRNNNMPFKYAHSRKACYQYSWDWAPEINTLGIWRNIELRIFDEIRFDYVWARNKLISEQEAIINFAAQLNLNTFRDEPLSHVYSMAVFLEGAKLVQKKIIEDTVYADVSINKPELWWPNGIGKPKIYDFEVKILEGTNIIETKKIPYGIRTVKLNLDNKAFQFIVNGYPVYCKGANYVPPDMLYPRLTNPSYSPKNTIENLLNDAVQSNYNMIRLWGGGQYESNEFLEMASRKGIMIFYDFMFSDSIYPSSEDFLINVEEEIKQQIRRARNYPALALWSGNNEILQGVEQWGWGSPKYREDYKKLFEVLIRKVVEIQNPEISYIPSSPIYGVGNYDFSKGGDFHYWGVWAGGREFQSYREAIGPFNSEFGTQALPVWHTIKQFTNEEDRNYKSSVFLAHERHGSQFRQLQSYIERYMKKSKNFEMQAYISGVLQAYAMEVAISGQRASKPRSYGTLYWQMNDAWPAISWSSIDYYGRWKPLQYMAKRIYPNIAIFADSKNKIHLINDNLYPVDVQAKVRVMDMSGKILQEKTFNQTLKLDSSIQIHTIDPIEQSLKRSSFIYCEIWHENKLQMKSTYFFEYFKNLEYPADATLKVSYHTSENTITLSSDKLLKNLFIDHKDTYVKFSDNYFDLIPNIPVTISVDGKSLQEIKDGLKYVSLREASEPGDLQVVIQTQ